MTTAPRASEGGRPLDRSARRRARELALQLLFSLDLNPPQGAQGVHVALHRGRERSLTAEAELAFAAGDLPRAEAATMALLQLDSRNPRAREYRAALDRKGPMPLPFGADERDEYEACAATSDILDLADQLTRGVMLSLDELDAHIGQASTNWRVSRMALVDRNILRLACHELLAMPETPAKVILNEAIEIAKRFGTAESRAFINGVLDKLAARVRPQDLPPA
jgi:transcription antitermination factor NusB